MILNYPAVQDLQFVSLNLFKKPFDPRLYVLGQILAKIPFYVTTYALFTHG